MKHMMRYLILLLVVAGMILGAIGCKKLSPEDIETQALAKQFMEAVFVEQDAIKAMTFVVPISTFGYVTAQIVEDTVAAEIKNSCVTTPDSVLPGSLSGDVTISEITATDGTKGITARTAWMVSSKFKCGGQGRDGDRISVVYLEKVNGTWGVAKVDWQRGLGMQSPAG
ncbi:MAG: hypothetical protein ACYCZF_06140 [Anaerolineae bacterium]